MRLLLESDIDKIIEKSAPGRNTNFLKASHNLWKRFKNYSKNPPIALTEKTKVVSILFTTFNKNKYTNLYEIVTIQGEEGNGFARKLWAQYVEYATIQKGMTRLKISCTPSSVTWHLKNGLVFWAVDPTGSLKSDQPIFPSIDAQKAARKLFLKNYKLALPNPTVIKNFEKSQLKHYSFGTKKHELIQEAIKKVGPAWLGDCLGQD